MLGALVILCVAFILAMFALPRNKEFDVIMHAELDKHDTLTNNYLERSRKFTAFIKEGADKHEKI